MIPLVAVINLQDQHSRTFRLWLPLILVWILLMPLAIMLSPFIFIGCLVCRMNPFVAFAVLWQIFSALKQTKFELGHRTAAISVCIL